MGRRAAPAGGDGCGPVRSYPKHLPQERAGLSSVNYGQRVTGKSQSDTHINIAVSSEQVDSLAFRRDRRDGSGCRIGCPLLSIYLDLLLNALLFMYCLCISEEENKKAHALQCVLTTLQI